LFVVGYFSLILTSVSFNAVTNSLQKGIFVDPCTPKGYSHNAELGKLSPGSLEQQNRYLADLQSKGNFSECRSAALMMLQKGKG
jgi:apyrase